MKKIVTMSRKITVRAIMTEQRMEVTAEEMNRICAENEWRSAEERKQFVGAHTSVCRALNPMVNAVRNFRNLAIIKFEDGSQRVINIMNMDHTGITRALLATVTAY